MDIEQYFVQSAAVKKELINEMINWCEHSECREMRILLNFAREWKYDTWYDCLTVGGGLYIMNLFLTSKRNMHIEEMKKKKGEENE